MRRGADWFGRVVLSVAGAALGAGAAAALEARALVAGGRVPGLTFFGAFSADYGVLVPLAMTAGLAVGVAALVVDPVRPRTPWDHAASLRRVAAARAAAPLLVV